MASNMENKKSPYYERLSGDVKDRYDEKIRKCGGTDPYTIKPKNLSLNPKDFPQITIYDITEYMIHSVSSYTKKFFENYKGTEAYKFFESGFVINIGSKRDNNLAIVTGKVMHSQRLNDSASHVWILAKLDGKVVCAHCTCVAGLSETCSHVGAICFAIHKISESKETKSVTDMLCKWNVPKFKEVSMSAAKDIDWRFPSRERATNEKSFLERCDSISHLSDARIAQFLDQCHSVGDDAALRTIIFPSEKKRLTNLRDEIFLASLYKENYRSKRLSELVDIGRAISLSLSEDDVNEILKLTLPRLKSKCYFGLRRGRITGSTFKHCCVSNVEDPSIVTIQRIISPAKNLDFVPSIKYQLQHKKTAIRQYINKAVLKHEDFVYTECGLIINPNLPYFAGSPDGLVYCSCHGDGCIEIKCFQIEEIDTLDDFLTRKPNNMFNKFGDKYTVERSHDLFHRIQLQINLNSLKYCDCIIWSSKKAFVVKVYADTDFWSTEIEKALKFHEQVIMPELLGKFYTQKKDYAESNDEIYEEEEAFELQRQKLIALEIEILGSDEWPEIMFESITPQAIESSDLSEPFYLSSAQFKNQLNECQQSPAIFPTTLSLEPQIQKDQESSFQPVVRDLKSLSLKEICSTFDYHQEYLNQIYSRLIKETKSHYYPRDLPSFAALDLVTEKQFEAMVQVAETKLVIVEQHNSTDVIFDAIIAEWAYIVFGKKYNLNRQQAVAAVTQMNSSKPQIHNLY